MSSTASSSSRAEITSWAASKRSEARRNRYSASAGFQSARASPDISQALTHDLLTALQLRQQLPGLLGHLPGQGVKAPGHPAVALALGIDQFGDTVLQLNQLCLANASCCWL